MDDNKEKPTGFALAERRELCHQMIAHCKDFVRRTEFAQGLLPNGKFYLVTSNKALVVYSEPDGTFKIQPVDPAKGYPWDSYTKAKKAANKWNGALDQRQLAAKCDVHPVSHAQYLEYCATIGAELLGQFEASMKAMERVQ